MPASPASELCLRTFAPLLTNPVAIYEDDIRLCESSPSSCATVPVEQYTYHLANAAAPARDQHDLALDVEEVSYLKRGHSDASKETGNGGRLSSREDIRGRVWVYVHETPPPSVRGGDLQKPSVG